MATTPRGVDYPEPGDDADVRTSLESLAQTVDFVLGGAQTDTSTNRDDLTDDLSDIQNIRGNIAGGWWKGSTKPNAVTPTIAFGKTFTQVPIVFITDTSFAGDGNLNMTAQDAQYMYDNMRTKKNGARWEVASVTPTGFVARAFNGNGVGMLPYDGLSFFWVAVGVTVQADITDAGTIAETALEYEILGPYSSRGQQAVSAAEAAAAKAALEAAAAQRRQQAAAQAAAQAAQSAAAAAARNRSRTVRATGATGDVRGDTLYYGVKYTHTGATSTIQLGSRPSAGSVTGGRIMFRNLHTFWNGGAHIHLNYEAAWNWSGVVPKSGVVVINLSRAEAQAIARSGRVLIEANPNNGDNYGYLSVSSFAVEFTYRG